jgi:hypothetical protein
MARQQLGKPMRCMICAAMLFAAATGRVSAECIDVPVTSLARSAEILMLARVDAVRGNPVPGRPNAIDGTVMIDGTIVNVTVKTLWKGSTPRQIELRQTLEAHEPQLWTSVGQEFVLSVRRLTPRRPLGAGYANIKPPVTAGFTAVACDWRPADKVDLNKFGRGRSPND